MKNLNRNPNGPGSLIPVTGVSEAELAGEDGLSDIALNLEHLRATLRLAIELEDESGIGLCPDIQVEVSGRAFGLFSDGNPAIVEHCGLGFGAGELQRNGDLPKEPPGVDAAGGAPPAGVDRDSEA